MYAEKSTLYWDDILCHEFVKSEVNVISLHRCIEELFFYYDEIKYFNQFDCIVKLLLLFQ